jgi:hypothetical protein
LTILIPDESVRHVCSHVHVRCSWVEEACERGMHITILKGET